MNERIKELYNQADKFAKENRTQNIAIPGNNYFELFHEKFAELIVADCASQLVQANMSNPTYAQAMDEYYENKWAHRFD
jgi:hypothetical protein